MTSCKGPSTGSGRTGFHNQLRLKAGAAQPHPLISPMSAAPPNEFELQPRTAAHAAGMFEVLRDPRLYTYLDYGPPASVEYLQSLYTRFAGPLSPDGSEYWLNWVIMVRGQCAGYVQATAPVERIFADWKCRRSLRRARYVGLAKNLSQFLLLAFTHNLRRWAVLTG
jgi:hypothetical protein